MNFRSVAQLADQLLMWSPGLPDVDLVVGVPRSGMLAGTLVGLYLNVPVTDVATYLAQDVTDTGRRPTRGTSAPGPRRVLVIDDSVYSGRSMAEVRRRLQVRGGSDHLMFAAVYVDAMQRDAVDFYCEVLESPRVFEWNILHRQSVSEYCIDLDGVLCHDPDELVNDDGAGYEEFLRTATRRHRCTGEIGWIVTARLERHRALTEDWLNSQGIQYRHLVMLDSTAERRRSLSLHSAFKADVYRQTGARLFVESSLRQSIEIANLAQRDVVCIDTMQHIVPGATPRDRYERFGDRQPNARLLQHLRRLARRTGLR